jgi:hypothetical protein
MFPVVFSIALKTLLSIECVQTKEKEFYCALWGLHVTDRVYFRFAFGLHSVVRIQTLATNVRMSALFMFKKPECQLLHCWATQKSLSESLTVFH